jgi:hypothetical protein
MLSHPADVEAELIGDDEQFLRVAVGQRQVAVAGLDVGQESRNRGACVDISASAVTMLHKLE